MHVLAHEQKPGGGQEMLSLEALSKTFYNPIRLHSALASSLLWTLNPLPITTNPHSGVFSFDARSPPASFDAEALPQAHPDGNCPLPGGHFVRTGGNASY